MRVTLIKLGVASMAYAAGLLILWVLLLVWPPRFSEDIQLRDWVEVLVLLVAVGGAAAAIGSRLRLRRSGVAGVLGVFLVIGAARVAPLPFSVGRWLLPASLAAAMLLIARPHHRIRDPT